MTLPTYDDVERAAEVLEEVIFKTPVMTSSTANAQSGATLFFKMENFQRGGSFKFRGAYHAISRLSDAERKRGVIAYSSGNHAQAVAIAARMMGVAATIVMPADAPAAKLAATRGYGATVITYDRATEDRAAIAARLVEEKGLTLIPPFDHADIVTGQGTAARGLLHITGELDYLYVPVGGGGLISGTALAAEGLSPRCKIIGVEPAAGDDVRQSLAKGERVSIPVPQTIADGAQTTQVGAITFPLIQRLVHEIVTVDDDALRAQMHFFMERMKAVVEPTGCLGAAAAMAMAPKGARVGVIVSGGNVDVAVAAAALRSGPTARLLVA